MIPGEMVIEKVYGLQCTGISIGDRFALIMAEHRARLQRARRRGVSNNQYIPIRSMRSNFATQMPQRELRTLRPWQQPIQQRLGMPALRRFGSDGNLPNQQRSNSFGSFNQFRNRIPWRQSNGNLSRGGSSTNLSQASWHGDRTVRGRSMGPFRGRTRGRGRRQQVGQLKQQTGRATSVPARGLPRTGGRGRGGMFRGQQNRNQQTGGYQPVNRKQPMKIVPTKEELDAQLDEYMASSQYALNKELEEYMLNGTTMQCE